MIRVQRKTPDDETQLRIGAAGQLMVEGKLKVLAAESDGFQDANPLKHGAFDLNEKTVEKREDAIVRNLLKKKGTVYLILGGAHDLTD